MPLCLCCQVRLERREVQDSLVIPDSRVLLVPTVQLEVQVIVARLEQLDPSDSVETLDSLVLRVRSVPLGIPEVLGSVVPKDSLESEVSTVRRDNKAGQDNLDRKVQRAFRGPPGSKAPRAPSVSKARLDSQV